MEQCFLVVSLFVECFVLCVQDVKPFLQNNISSQREDFQQPESRTDLFSFLFVVILV